MTRKTALFSLALAVLLVVPTLAAAESSWTGEVVDLACYKKDGARGEEHAACAKRCLQRGGEMGLLTDDGTLVLLMANSDDPKPYQALVDLAGEKAQVTGELAEKDGMKVVTVTGSKAAS